MSDFGDDPESGFLGDFFFDFLIFVFEKFVRYDFEVMQIAIPWNHVKAFGAVITQLFAQCYDFSLVQSLC